MTSTTVASSTHDQVKSVTGAPTLLGKQQTVTLNALRFNCYDNPRAKR